MINFIHSFSYLKAELLLSSSSFSFFLSFSLGWFLSFFSFYSLRQRTTGADRYDPDARILGDGDNRDFFIPGFFPLSLLSLVCALTFRALSQFFALSSAMYIYLPNLFSTYPSIYTKDTITLISVSGLSICLHVRGTVYPYKKTK